MKSITAAPQVKFITGCFYNDDWIEFEVNDDTSLRDLLVALGHELDPFDFVAEMVDESDMDYDDIKNEINDLAAEYEDCPDILWLIEKILKKVEGK